MNDEVSCICDSCGEEIVIPLAVAGGASQEYVEDYPVCCHPNVIHVEIGEDGEARVWARIDDPCQPQFFGFPGTIGVSFEFPHSLHER
jgi:Cysteine-rich CPXCG